MVEAGDDAYLMLNFAANFSLVMLISVMLIKKREIENWRRPKACAFFTFIFILFYTFCAILVYLQCLEVKIWALCESEV